MKTIWQQFIQDGNGNAIAGASVTVRKNGTIASIFDNKSGTISRANPFLSDSKGYAFFYADAGLYDIEVTAATGTTSLYDVAVGTAQAQDMIADGGIVLSDAPSDGKTYARKNAAWEELKQEVQAYANFAVFPATGAANVIYIDKAYEKSYYWDGSAYVALTGGRDYPLDDDGTLAASLGFGFAGVARGDGQKLDYETAGGSGVKLLMAKDTFTTARFSRGATATIGYEAVCIKNSIGVGGSRGLALVISDSGGSLVNAVTMSFSSTNDLGQILVDSSGNISAKLNGSAYSLAGSWMNPSGQKTVGASDKFAPYLYATDNGTTGERDIVQLITDASKMSGEYPFGAKDIHGRLI